MRLERNNLLLFKKIIMDVILSIMNKEIIDLDELKIKYYFIDEISLMDILSMLVETELISEPIEDGMYKYYDVLHHDFDKLHYDIKNFILNDIGVSKDEFESYIKFPEEYDDSEYLNDPETKWVNVEKELPKPNVHVKVRLLGTLYDTHCGDLVEDVKVAKFSSNENEFIISPPHPVFDHSPLTHFEKLKDCALVTHWAYIDNDELCSWQNRFKTITDMTGLEFYADRELGDKIYMTLMNAIQLIDDAYTNDNEEIENDICVFEVLAMLGDIAYSLNIKEKSDKE